MDDVFVLKFGGNAIKGRDDLDRLAREVSGLIGDGARIVMVHGGGPEINAEMERLGLEPKKVAGVRITDDRTLEVAERVLRGINADVVDAMKENGVLAAGMPGYHVASFERRRPYTVIDHGVETTVDLMNVGDVTGASIEVIEDLLYNGVTPVIYPIGEDSDGNRLNVNADAMAAGIAAGIGCREMIQITDVPGVMLDIDDPSSLQSELTVEQVDDLISSGVISGGMVAKVEACKKALKAGVPKVRLVNGRDQGSIVSDVMQKGIRHGTVIRM